MKITKIILKNYRGFPEASFEFHDHINVIYGRNGTGKSTILKALSLLCTALKSNKTGLPSRTVFLHGHDFNAPDRDCSIGMEFYVDTRKYFFSIIKKSCDYDSENNFSLSQEADVLNGHVNPFTSGQKFKDGTYYSGDLKELKKIYCLHASFFPGQAQMNIKAIPSRTLGGFDLRIENTTPRFAIMKGLGSFSAMKEFIEERENLEAQKRLDSEPDHRDPVLQSIRNAVAKMGDNFGRIKIDRNKRGKPLLVEKNGCFFNLATQLSEGEAGLIALWCALAALGHESGSAHSPILIDEIDISLHPSWQVKVVPQMSSIWPNAQLIVTSHSPFVWSELKREHIIHLIVGDDGQIKRVPAGYAFGGSMENITADFFEIGPYAKNFQTELDQMEDLIHVKKFRDARKKMEDLREQYGELPVLVRLQTKIKALDNDSYTQKR